ncbi:uncharacterized protein GLRG_09678 [Colletotrichum graminicola M1.001]|uniref:Uncharacterized protein n=1 Tax=Colletotrichum graminicola (strain M1.001 / M2 / FGSC 10212) TaxID=645133 RepID=E3QUJ6_COLGM|nr:uncharacterized protein GLRG_09678 [Colletotrichum graminicola M1.001]EFQ34534.1 hypothetical protein GLRG_09678 [Colletotrichum graminicola M1.001]
MAKFLSSLENHAFAKAMMAKATRTLRGVVETSWLAPTGKLTGVAIQEALDTSRSWSASCQTQTVTTCQFEGHHPRVRNAPKILEAMTAVDSYCA